MTPWQLLTSAYHQTVSHPKRWWLGLFLGSTFTLPWLILLGTRFGTGLRWQMEFSKMSSRFGLSGSLGILFVGIIFTLLVTSWVKAILVIWLARDQRFPGFEEHMNNNKRFQSRRYISGLVFIALITTLAMGSGLALVTAPFVNIGDTLSADVSVIGSLVVVLLFLTFVVSVVGVFSSFAVILLDLTVGRALKLAGDLLTSRWQEVVGVVSAISVVYAVFALAGVAVLSFVDTAFKLVVPPQLGTGQMFAMIHVLRLCERLLLWGWLALLNIFVYTALYLLFSHLTQGGLKKSEELLEQPALQVEPS